MERNNLTNKTTKSVEPQIYDLAIYSSTSIVKILKEKLKNIFCFIRFSQPLRKLKPPYSCVERSLFYSHWVPMGFAAVIIIKIKRRSYDWLLKLHSILLIYIEREGERKRANIMYLKMVLASWPALTTLISRFRSNRSGCVISFLVIS